MYGLDKVIHSAVGLGVYLTLMICSILNYLDLNWLIWITPLLLGAGKELVDKFRYGKFDKRDLWATLNPFIVLKWYKKQIGK